MAAIKARIRRGRQKRYDSAIKQFESSRSSLQDQCRQLQAALRALRSDYAKHGALSLYASCFDELAAFISAWRTVSRLAGASSMQADLATNQFDEEAKAMVLQIAEQHQRGLGAPSAVRALSLAHAVCDERFQSKLATIDRIPPELEPAFEAYCDAADDYLHTASLASMTGSTAIDADRKRMLNQLNAGRRTLAHQIAVMPMGHHKEHWQSQLSEHTEEFDRKRAELAKSYVRDAI
ncbi:hypothetical protein [Duganella qianjiadongensis]|uniref:Uncharacterized protein n=1 Tax=Duganella qianjiadongensis TaxID=2692176 RepID=A0ABW9VGQ4_9BURK|nr:hypothetical protein [Duganella qianjiadongensis]MYM38643.1 hypothetical protein [Duganella qianjiadongensis]